MTAHDRPLDPDEMRALAARFRLGGAAVRAEPYGTGHIHDTYAVTLDPPDPAPRCIFQRINHRIFRDVDRLMANILRVTRHIRDKAHASDFADAGRATLTVIPAADGAPYVLTEQGDFWRAYLFIEQARTYDIIGDNRHAYEAGRAFGRFQELLADFPPPPLHETIPRFHDTPARYAAFERAVADDRLGRVRACRPEIAFARTLRPFTRLVTDALATGALPLRVTHNDTKINNVMIDDETGTAVCVIDLDTVMHGSVLYDFGDQIRTSVGHFDESETDLDRVEVDLDTFAALARGYIEVAATFLTPRETDWLVAGGKLMTFEVGIRFLADFLEGDVYFKIRRERENLDRARTQFKLVRSLTENEERMRRLIAELRK